MKKISLFICIFLSVAALTNAKTKEYYKKHIQEADKFLTDNAQKCRYAIEETKIYEECGNAQEALRELKFEKNAKNEVVKYCTDIYPKTSANKLVVKECKRIEAEIKANKWDYREWDSYNKLQSFLKTQRKEAYIKELTEEAKVLSEKNVINYCTNFIYPKTQEKNIIYKECKRIESEIKENKWNYTEWSPNSKDGLDDFMADKFGYSKLMSAKASAKYEYDVLKYCADIYTKNPESKLVFKECKRIEAEIQADKWDYNEWSSWDNSINPFLRDNRREAYRKEQAIDGVIDYCNNDIYQTRTEASIFFKECKRIEAEIQNNSWNYDEWMFSDKLDNFLFNKYDMEYKWEVYSYNALSYCYNDIYLTKAESNIYFKECKRIEAEILERTWGYLNEWDYSRLDSFISKKYGDNAARQAKEQNKYDSR